ncbi:hypothetical protein A2110_02025 [Candidatus Jorgensenbacteria bacterium GWA1_54_12]|uniref:Endolytic murein transglycosylase n=1 Tax=Candidatus Jorgensenbacteria bacterium GWA1_54_12 TaxID=1798468 RepID=A0A1F6BLV4_9BACT|nr:MAG: hypothetical protein A2110_02025 [Candidatus Jorgensenbacteria bacterium GWA1_54_12]
MARTRFFIGLAAAFLFLMGIGYFFYGLQPVGEGGTSVTVTIERGTSFRDIAAELSQKNLTKSLTIFKVYSLLMGRAHTFKPGTYTLSPAFSVPEIVHLLSSGGTGDIAVVIPEGSTVKDTDKILASAGILKAGTLASLRPSELIDEFPFLDTLPSLEGFLFPDTYRFEPGTTGKDVARAMLQNFVKKAWPIVKDEPEWYGKLILASFVEREVPKLRDRQVIAGIFLKRLDVGMPLQVDATVSFAKCNGAFLECAAVQIGRDDTKTSSPFNTYASRGLTPTPIANPGVEALEAVVTPLATPYWYYLSARATGETIFSQTLEEHNVNRARYL